MAVPTVSTASRSRALRPRGKASPGDARTHNRALILQSLFRGEPHSRADLARLTGLTRVTVSDVVAGLLTDGLVRELGPRAEARVGKPATLVTLAPDVAHVVAVDLSEDEHLRGAVLDLTGTVLHREGRSRGGRTGDDALALVLELAGSLVAGSARPVLGIGVGTPGVVSDAGVVLDAPNLAWRDRPLARALEDALDVPVHVGNDANMAALAEHTFADAHEGGTLVLTVGQGVGAGLLLDGALVLGSRFAAGEIGHVVVDPQGPPCACGRRGCLETFLAAPALRERGESALAGRLLGEVLAPVVSALNLAEVVLGGPVELLDGPLLESAREAVRRRTMPVVADTVEFRTSSLGEDAVLLGSAALVLSRQLGVA